MWKAESGRQKGGDDGPQTTDHGAKVAAGGFPAAGGCQPPVAEQCFPGVMIDCGGAQAFA
jgi:hypothetical protein